MLNNPKEKAYVATIQSIAVRDAQFCTDARCAIEDDESWADAQDMPLYVGVFKGESEQAVLEKAARFACTDSRNINLTPVDEAKGDGAGDETEDACSVMKSFFVKASDKMHVLTPPVPVSEEAFGKQMKRAIRYVNADIAAEGQPDGMSVFDMVCDMLKRLYGYRHEASDFYAFDKHRNVTEKFR